MNLYIRKTDWIRNDLFTDVDYGERSTHEVYLWMFLLTLDYLKIIDPSSKININHAMTREFTKHKVDRVLKVFFKKQED